MGSSQPSDSLIDPPTVKGLDIDRPGFVGLGAVTLVMMPMPSWPTKEQTHPLCLSK